MQRGKLERTQGWNIMRAPSAGSWGTEACGVGGASNPIPLSPPIFSQFCRCDFSWLKARGRLETEMGRNRKKNYDSLEHCSSKKTKGPHLEKKTCKPVRSWYKCDPVVCEHGCNVVAFENLVKSVTEQVWFNKRLYWSGVVHGSFKSISCCFAVEETLKVMALWTLDLPGNLLRIWIRVISCAFSPNLHFPLGVQYFCLFLRSTLFHIQGIETSALENGL